mmetsp:Transcript_126490/g.366180  ORF Transcript_126490/g.366180 Transcript_126490/m.366180 type:complete len:571 (+) Transcript_126490:76-1788(+)
MASMPRRAKPLERTFGDFKSRIQQESAEQAEWSKAQVAASELASSTAFCMSMSALVFLNMVCVIIEVNHSANDKDMPRWRIMANFGALIAYLIDVCINLFVFRMRFFNDPFKVLDFGVVLVDIIVSIIVAKMSVSLAPLVFVRLARLLRTTRALRMLSVFPELKVLMNSLLFASKTILWGVVLLASCLCFWGIFATLFIHPIVKDLQREGYWERLGCERCPRAFESVELSMLTFCQQLIVGEGWSEINTPLIEQRPETAIFFTLVLVSLMLAAFNLLLGVMVERASEANAETLKELAAKKEKARQEASEKLYKMCEELDVDGSGTLTFDELLQGYQEHPEFACSMELMDIDERDLDIVFDMLDTDCSGDVDYKEFVEQLHMMKSGEPHTLLIFIKYYTMEMRASLNKALSAMHVGDSAAPTRRFSGPGRASRVGRASQGTFRYTSCIGEVEALPGASMSFSQWPMFDVELQELTEIRKEVMKFSQLQVDKIEMVSQRLKASLLEASSATTVREAPCSSTSTCRTADPVMVEAPPGEAQPESGNAAPRSGASMCGTADLASCFASQREVHV